MLEKNTKKADPSCSWEKSLNDFQCSKVKPRCKSNQKEKSFKLFEVQPVEFLGAFDAFSNEETHFASYRVISDEAKIM